MIDGEFDNMKIHGVIYKVTNLINGKIYIGKGSDFKNRKKHHMMLVRNGTGYALHNAIRKHGVENFNWCVIDQAYSEDELCDKEVFWIAYYESFRDYGKGYNLTTGGDGGNLSEETKKKIGDANRGEKSGWYGKKHSEETKKKIGEGNKGKVYTDEAKDKISEARKKYVGEKHHMYGKNHSEETKNKMRESKKNSQYNNRPKSVVQLSKDKEFIAEFKTIAEAKEQTGINRDGISSCCRGLRKDFRGYIWMFKEDYLNMLNSQTG